MKQACCHPLFASRGFVGVLGLLILLALVSSVLVSCNKAPKNEGAAPPPVAGAPDTTDRTVGGSAPGQITTEPAQSIPGKAMQRAMAPKCESNLNQLRLLVGSAKEDAGESGAYPASLDTISEAARINKCPVSGKPYDYDPATGTVKCLTTGHEKF